MSPEKLDQHVPVRSLDAQPRFTWMLSWIGILGIAIVPMLIVVAVNSWQAPDADAYVRMAFGQVAGQTIAILTALALVAFSIWKRSRGLITVMALVAFLVIASSLFSMQRTGDWLLIGLG